MTDTRPEWLNAIANIKGNIWDIDEKEGEIWKIEQNQNKTFNSDENIEEAHEKAEKFLKAAQSEDGTFEFRRRYKNGKEQLVFIVDRWTVGVVSLDLEAGFDAINRDPPNKNLQKSVRITSKIEDADWPAMLALARDWSNVDFSGPRRDANKSEDNLAGFIAYAYDSALKELLTEYGGLRQKHRTVKRDLEAEIKGSVRISEYLTNITRGEVTTVPCSFSELTMDNQPNRVLLHALHGAQRLVRDHAGFENTEINRRLLRHRRKFAAVTHERVRPSQLNQLESLPTAFDGYEQSNALEIAGYIIEETDLGIETGDYESIELTAVMWRLFENAFAQVVADKLDVKRDDIAQDNWTYQIGENNEISPEQDKDGEEKSDYRQKQMRPDIYLDSDTVGKHDDEAEGGMAIVADTKWKQVAPIAKNDDNDLSGPSNSDLFQITTYRDVAAKMDESDAVGFLVYPYIKNKGDSEDVRCCPFSLDNGAQNTQAWGDIYAIGWQVGTTGGGTDLRDSAKETINKMIETADSSN